MINVRPIAATNYKHDLLTDAYSYVLGITPSNIIDKKRLVLGSLPAYLSILEELSTQSGVCVFKDAYRHITLTYIIWGDSYSLEYIVSNTRLTKTIKYSNDRRRCVIVVSGNIFEIICDLLWILKSSDACEDTIKAYTAIYRSLNLAGLKEIWESFKIVDIDNEHIKVY